MLVRTIRRTGPKRRRRTRTPPRRARRSASDRRHRESEKDLQARRYVSGVSLLAFFVSSRPEASSRGSRGSPIPFVAAVLVGVFLLFSLKVANQWERAVVLRFGTLRRASRARASSSSIPVVDEISQLVDQRVRVTDVSAESALTKDTVPVNVDAIVFWTVWDAQKSVLEVADFLDADRAFGADGAPRDDRPPHARRDDHRARAAREAAPDDPRREDEPVGHHGPVRRDPRREDPGRPRGRDVAPGAGRARAPGPHHPRNRGDRDRRRASSRRATPTRTTRSRSTCAP